MNYISIEVWILNDGSFFNTFVKSHSRYDIFYSYVTLFRWIHLQNTSHFLWIKGLSQSQIGHIIIVCHTFKSQTFRRNVTFLSYVTLFRFTHLQNKSHFLWFVTILRFVTLQKSHTFIVCHSFKAVTLTFLLRRKERIKEKNVLKLKIRMTFLHFLMGTTKLFQVFENYQLHIHMWSPFSI